MVRARDDHRGAAIGRDPRDSTAARIVGPAAEQRHVERSVGPVGQPGRHGVIQPHRDALDRPVRSGPEQAVPSGVDDQKSVAIR
jgi:hypothetical protein